LFVLACVRPQLISFQKIFNNSVNANQHPEKFYDERGEIEIERERKNYQTRADGVQDRVKQSVAFNASGLQQNIRENNRRHAD
jgi:hypothetical protein